MDLVELKFRRKGEIVTISGIFEMPEDFAPPESLSGVDLTRYPVILITGGRRTLARAREMHEKAPRAIIVAQSDWSYGAGDYIFVPENLDPSRVSFYKGAEQVEEEEIAARHARSLELQRQVVEAAPDIRGHASYGKMPRFAPRQEVFHSTWEVAGETLEEVLARIKLSRPLWREWNERGLAAYRAITDRDTPGIGNLGVESGALCLGASPKEVTMSFWHNGGRVKVTFTLTPDGWRFK